MNVGDQVQNLQLNEEPTAGVANNQNEAGAIATKTASQSSNGGLICSDLGSFILILILYLVGNNKTCGIPIDTIILIYIIVKASFIGIRCCQICTVLANPSVGVISTISFTLFAIVGIIVYYVFALIYFFKDDNDCLDEATVMWVALLLIVIEAFSFFFVISIL